MQCKCKTRINTRAPDGANKCRVTTKFFSCVAISLDKKRRAHHLSRSDGRSQSWAIREVRVGLKAVEPCPAITLRPSSSSFLSSNTTTIINFKTLQRMGRIKHHELHYITTTTPYCITTSLVITLLQQLPRIAFLANRYIRRGEELRWDYGETSSRAMTQNPWLEK